MRDSTVFYRSFYEAVKDLPPEDFKKSVCAIMDYALDGIPPDTTGIEKTMYIMAKPQIDVNNRRYENSKHGGRKPNANQSKTKTEPSVNQDNTKGKPNVNVNDNVNANGKKESTEKKHFVPPTRQDVAEYCRENGYHKVDVERFINYYTSNGWMAGKSKMKDWKAAVRNWERSEIATKPNNTRGNRFTNFGNQRQYDFGSLERQLLGGGDHGQGRQEQAGSVP